MSSVLSRIPHAFHSSQDSKPLDGRGGTAVEETGKAPRYLYYRLYTRDGSIKSINPIYVNDPFTSRTITRLITPPHTSMSVKDHLCKIEGFKPGTASTLFESLLSQVTLEESTRVSLKKNSGPGLSEDDPMALVVELLGDEQRGPPTKPRSLPDSGPREPRYLYYRIYDKGGAIASKMSFDPDDEFLGRIDTLSVTPPHTVSSLGFRIANAEGIVKNKFQLFEDTDGDHLMNDDKYLSLLEQTYPGCAEDGPIAVVCVEVMEETQVEPQMLEGKTEEDTTFSKLMEANTTWTPTDANLPVWLPTTKNEILHTDGVRTNAMYIGGPSVAGSYVGYMAINSAGEMGFIAESFCQLC